MSQTDNNKNLILKIYLTNGVISLLTSSEKHNEIANYVLNHINNKTMCILKDNNGSINALCKGESIIGLSFEASTPSLQNKYLEAATKHYDVATQISNLHLQEMKQENWKYTEGSSET